jgi:hypothetical protein
MANTGSLSIVYDCVSCVRKVGPRQPQRDQMTRVPVLVEQPGFGAKVPHDFILDSGANISLIPARLAGKLGIDPNIGEFRRVHGAGGDGVARCRELRVRLPGPLPARLMFGFPQGKFLEVCLLSAVQIAEELRIVLCGDGVCFRPMKGMRERRRSPRLRGDGCTVEFRTVRERVQVLELSMYGVLVKLNNGRTLPSGLHNVNIASKHRTFVETVVVAEPRDFDGQPCQLLTVPTPTVAFAQAFDAMYSAALLGHGDWEIVGKDPSC